MTLSKRLAAAAALVRPGTYIADVGTDHAYLPIALCESASIRGALASDINRGPIDRARANIAASGLSHMIETRLCGGIAGIESHSPDDILILGMGGELIAEIISASQYPRREGVRLILQPMTKQAELRESLTREGYEITDDILVEDDRIYQLLTAEYRGEVEPLEAVEYLLGQHNIARGGDLLCRYAGEQLKIYETRRIGLIRGGRATDAEDKMIAALKNVIEHSRKEF